MQIGQYFTPATQETPATATFVATESTLPDYFPQPMQIDTARDQHRDVVERGGTYIVGTSYPPEPTRVALLDFLTRLFTHPAVVIVSLNYGMSTQTDGFVMQIALRPEETKISDTLALHVGVQLEMFERRLFDAYQGGSHGG